MEQANLERRAAEAVLNLQPSASIAISYHPLFGHHNDIMLLELDEKLLPDILHQRVVVRGQPDEDAVLCTQSKTYAIKFVGTSNSVFLIPPSDQSEFSDNLLDENDQSQLPVASILKVATGTMELVEVAPKLDKLKLLLFKNLYRPEVDIEMEGLGEVETGLYKWDDLVDLVQASDDELLSGLQALSALEIDGYWRVVDVKYMDMMLRMLLHNSVLNDWSLDALDQDRVVDVLQSDGFPHKLAEHCLCVYGHKVSEGVETNCVWKLDERKVCVHFAREILRGGKKKIEKFMEEWNRKVPECMQASFTMLEGEVLTERFGIETWVRALSVSSLPSSPAERFSLLFKERQKWEWKDLQPYIRDLSVPGLSSEGLLLKYTRRTQPTADAEPVFSAR
ncbi:hypothetical protein L484_023881 [Morus notabilis]|uniref:Sister chromatid cohesion protein DCC1 n=1 Tax=Morus notabilis TaxID=981085 RepID=W9RDJ4_9ROSA|nr:sister chromatid cohesion protein DCC1 [Morus notabilis]EXB70695.1 hypothetical protein L484_023881 [Morus notabilis]